MLSVPGTLADGAVSGSPYVHMDGGGVFKFAVRVMAEVAQEALGENGLDATAIDWLIPHQANVRIIDATAKKLGVPPEKVVVTVDRHANTSAASIPLALDEAGVTLGNRDREPRGHHRASTTRTKRHILSSQQIETGIAEAYTIAGEAMACNMMDDAALDGVQAFIDKRKP